MRGRRWLLPLALLLAGCDPGGGRVLAGGAAPLDVYAEPPRTVRQILLAEGEQGAPREVRLFVPEADGAYPLLQFQHGFVSDVDTYTSLLSRLAGFGFVIAAPQMYVGDPSSAPSVPEETAAAVDVLVWVQSNVNAVLADQLGPELAVSANPARTGLLGHSRGGQVAWRMLFDHSPSASAIAGIDPVDGDAPPFPAGGTGELVTDDPGAFAFGFPSLIIGMGQGSSGAPGFECAPENRNYQLFYDASAPPRYEVVADNHGHSDMLNGDNPEAVCPGALDGSREALRVFVAGQLASYFSAVLGGSGDFSRQKELGIASVPASVRFSE